MGGGTFGGCIGWIGVIMRSEKLDELPEVYPDSKRTSFIAKLLKAENLPCDDVVPGGERTALKSGLFASESLPFDERPAPVVGRSSFIATLFSRESLPDDTAQEPGLPGRGPRGLEK